MNINFFGVEDRELSPLKNFLLKKGGFLHTESDIDNFFQNAVRYPSNVFLLKSTPEKLILLLDSIKDLRTYFGSFPLIYVLLDRNDHSPPTAFLNVGADNVFRAPFDLALLEDNLGHGLSRDSFLPLAYRHVPSGGSPISLKRPVHLYEINSEGLHFYSEDFIARGTSFKVDLTSFLDYPLADLKCRVIQVDQNNSEHDFRYRYQAEFFEIDKELKKQIRFLLKKTPS